MEHRLFWKKHARRGSIFKSSWFLSSASSASCLEIKLAIDHVLSISPKRNFALLINQFTRVLTSSALRNYVVEALYVVEYNHVPVVLIFISFDWATGDITVDIMAFLQTSLGGKIEHDVLGQNGTVGQNGTGQNGTMPFYPKGVPFCPNALVRFTPRPFHTRKFQWRKWLNGSRKR